MITFEGTNYYNTAEVAEKLNTRKKTVCRYIREGRLAAVKQFGEWIISAAAIEDFLRAEYRIHTGRGGDK